MQNHFGKQTKDREKGGIVFCLMPPPKVPESLAAHVTVTPVMFRPASHPRFRQAPSSELCHNNSLNGLAK